jgi:hypothetical protein
MMVSSELAPELLELADELVVAPVSAGSLAFLAWAHGKRHRVRHQLRESV